MEYYNGFVFYLDENNSKWKEYYTNLGKKTFGVYSVAQYFTKKLKELADDKLDKVFNIESSYINQLSDNSLHLSEKAISNWKDIYSDLLQQGDVCVIAIPGYLWKGTPQTSYSFMTKVARKEVTLSDVLTIPEYAELVEKLFILRFGKKPQDCTTDTVEFFIPALQCAISEHFVASDSEDKTQTKKENTLQAPAQPVVNETVVEGYFYKKTTGQADGKNKKYNGTSKKAYAVKEFKEKYYTADVIDLNISNDDLNIFANSTAKESSGNKKESYAIASTIVNLATYRNKTILNTLKTEGIYGYNDGGNSTSYKNNEKSSMEAVINALTNGKDNSNGAIRWDGFDLAAKGFNHVKAVDCGIRISETLFNSFKAAWSDDLINRYSGGKYTKFSDNFKAGDHKATGRNKGCICYEASAVEGLTMFWKKTDDPSFTGGYF